MADVIVQTTKGPRRVTDKVREAARKNAIKARAAYLKKYKAGQIKFKKRQRKGIKNETVEIPLEALPASQPVAKKKYKPRAAAPVGANQSYAEFVAAAWQALNNLKGN